MKFVGTTIIYSYLQAIGVINDHELNYSDNWINQRLKSIEIRKDLTDQWKTHNVEEGVQYASLTDIIYQTWAGKTAKEYKQLKGLKKESLRDNMTNEVLVLNMLAELSATSITKAKNPQTLDENKTSHNIMYAETLRKAACW